MKLGPRHIVRITNGPSSVRLRRPRNKDDDRRPALSTLHPNLQWWPSCWVSSARGLQEPFQSPDKQTPRPLHQPSPSSSAQPLFPAENDKTHPSQVPSSSKALSSMPQPQTSDGEIRPLRPSPPPPSTKSSATPKLATPPTTPPPNFHTWFQVLLPDRSTNVNLLLQTLLSMGHGGWMQREGEGGDEGGGFGWGSARGEGTEGEWSDDGWRDVHA